ncbi:MAG: outer membrane protein [Gammaproteobacteria bacterium]
MNKLIIAIATIVSLMPVSAYAEEPMTELGIYVFASEVSGDVGIRNVTIDVDASFSEILDNLDLGFMGYFEHRRDKWSFIGDLVYLKIEDDASASLGPLTLDVDIGLEQTLLEGFAGYNVLERDYGESKMNMDILVGARHVLIESDISAEVSLLLPFGPRSIDEDWTDAVIGVRFRNTYQNGWSSKVWIDVGEGSDSSSYQLMAFVGYQKSDSWKLFGGYRYLNLEYEKGSGTSRFGVDLDYSGPMFGATYRL